MDAGDIGVCNSPKKAYFLFMVHRVAELEQDRKGDGGKSQRAEKSWSYQEGKNKYNSVSSFCNN
jgi:hypothetical protein